MAHMSGMLARLTAEGEALTEAPVSGSPLPLAQHLSIDVTQCDTALQADITTWYFDGFSADRDSQDPLSAGSTTQACRLPATGTQCCAPICCNGASAASPTADLAISGMSSNLCSSQFPVTPCSSW